MGNLASSCVRDCVRTSHEFASEDLLHVSAEAPGLSSSGSRAPGQVPAVPPNGAASSEWKTGSVEANAPGGSASSAVPPVPNWFQVLGNARASREGLFGTPRFDEVARASPRTAGGPLDQMTPRGNIGGEFRTPGPTPREGPTPRDSPRTSEGDAGKSDEVSYDGMYLGTMKHGKGKLWMTSSVYEGDFLNDAKHGMGTLSWDDGRKYTGGFDEGKFHGSAVMTWPDGRKYTGQYSEDKKHGDGTFSWQDGRRYQGQWVFGKRHGVGTYTNAKGLTRRGMWQMDRPIHWEAPGQELNVMSGPSVTAAQVAEAGPSREVAPVSSQAIVVEPGLNVKEVTLQVADPAPAPAPGACEAADTAPKDAAASVEAADVEAQAGCPLPCATASDNQGGRGRSGVRL